MTKTPAPSKIIPYLSSLLYTPWRHTLGILGGTICTSHDTLTRLLRVKFSWNILLVMVLTRFKRCRGYVIIDDTEIVKMFAKKIPLLSWLHSHSEGRYIYGLNLVVIAWTNGTVTIPFAFRLYHPDSGKTKIDLAVLLINFTMSLGVQPEAFLFDAFYAAEKVLKTVRSYGIDYFTQAPKSRLLDGIPLKRQNGGRPYWTKMGTLRGGLKVMVVKVRRKYFISSRLTIKRHVLLAIYKLRWKIEEVFRFTKSELGLERCQSSTLQSQINHIGSCFMLYGLLQDIAVYPLNTKGVLTKLPSLLYSER